MEHVLPKAGQLFFPWYAVGNSICIEFRNCSVVGYTFFFINSSSCTNSMHVSTIKLTLWSVSNNLCFKARSCIPSIKRSMINSSSVVISLVPSLSNSPYLALSFNRCTNCTIDSSGCCLVSWNFVLSAMANLFFGLIFLFVTPKSALLDILGRPLLKLSGLLRSQLLRGTC